MEQVETYLVMRGQPFSEIEKLPLRVVTNVYFVLANGVEGWYADADSRYMQYSQQFAMSDEKPKSFQKVFPIINSMRTLDTDSELSLADKWLKGVSNVRSTR